MLLGHEKRLALLEDGLVAGTELLNVSESPLKPVDGVGLANLIGVLRESARQTQRLLQCLQGARKIEAREDFVQFVCHGLQLGNDVVVDETVPALFIDGQGHVDGERNQFGKQRRPKLGGVSKVVVGRGNLWWNPCDSHVGSVENLEFGFGRNDLCGQLGLLRTQTRETFVSSDSRR